jgi:transposase-like protein
MLQLLRFRPAETQHFRQIWRICRLHLRTTNPIESTFATIRLRHRRTKGSGSRRTSLAMMFKLAETASKRRRRLIGHQLILHVIHNHKITDGIVQANAV